MNSDGLKHHIMSKQLMVTSEGELIDTDWAFFTGCQRISVEITIRFICWGINVGKNVIKL